MKRLLFISALTIATISAGGCGGGMWNWWHRGSQCTNYETNYGSCDSTPLAHGTLLPPTSGNVIPGPVETIPPPP